MGVSRTGDFETYVADIEHPRSASLTVYQDALGWLTITDSDGGQTTLAVNLDDEGDWKFAEQLCMVAGVLAVLMSEEDGEDDGGDEPA